MMEKMKWEWNKSAFEGLMKGRMIGIKKRNESIDYGVFDG